MNNYSNVPFRLLSALAAGALVASCGGGGSSLVSSAGSTLGGVAASGAPIANATIVITCADGTTKTGTANASGEYSVDVSGCTAPLVISATGQVGEAEQTLVSVYPSAVTGSATANVTPITNAIASTLASDGNPLTLAASIATEKNNITVTAVTTRNSALATSLAPALQQAGVTGAVDLISTPFSANRSGVDKLLDNLKVTVTPSGVAITNVGGAKVDDMGNLNGQSTNNDLSAAGITITRTTNFGSGLPQLPATVDDMSLADSAMAAFNTCFALPAAQRGTVTSPAAACASLPVAIDYLHNGRNAAGEFDRYLTSASYDRATFAKPEVIRFFSSSATDTRALVRFGLVRSDGVGEFLETVVEKSPATGNVYKMRGNQRLFRVGITGYITREEQLGSRGTTRPQGAYYHTGLNVYFGYAEGGAGGTPTGGSRGTGRRVQYVKVTGPGLPAAGIILNARLSGCDSYYAIALNATTAPTSCTSLFRMQYRKATAADPENTFMQTAFGSGSNPEFASQQSTDAELKAILPFAAYKFEIFYNAASTTPDLVYYERLRSRPVALGLTPGAGEVDSLRFNTGLATATKTLITPGVSGIYTGGSAFTVTWANVAKTPSINAVQVQSRVAGTLYQDDAGVSMRATSVTLTNQGAGWGDMSQAATSGNFNLVQLKARDATDTVYFHNWRY